MKLIKKITLLSTILVAPTIFGQEKEDITPKINQLLQSKLKQFNTNNYTIQLYYGNYEEAKKVQKEFEETYEGKKCDIKLETPNYKVWIGEYSSRLEADKALLEIHEKFQHAFAVKL